MSIKQLVIDKLQSHLEQQITDANSMILAAEDSRNSETKSSMGDKYETSRNIIQAEIDKSKMQLAKALSMKNELGKLNSERIGAKVEWGSLVFTDKGNFLISVGLGKVLVDDVEYFAISLASPIGQQLDGKAVGEVISFRNTSYLIEEIQ